jgi:hypothetical protein
VFGRRRVIAIGGLLRQFARGLAIPCAVALAVTSGAQNPIDPPSSAGAQNPIDPPSSAGAQNPIDPSSSASAQVPIDPPSSASAQVPTDPPSSASVLTAAFANRYEVDAISWVELVIRNGSVVGEESGEETRRTVHYVTKLIDERLHSIARLTAPEYLRGMTILTIEQRNRNYDAFVFLPSLGKTRRVNAAQKDDAFFGSDLTFGDLERKRVDDFELGELVVAESDGEVIYRIRAELVRKGKYSRVEFDVAQSDYAILAERYYKRREEKPYRVVQAPRPAMVEQGGHVLPTRLLVTDLLRGGTTEVRIEDLRVNASIPDRIFTVATLEQERKLPEP